MNVIKEPAFPNKKVISSHTFLIIRDNKDVLQFKGGYLRMIKRKFRVLITPVLLLGLAACNNDTDTAMDVQNRDQNNTAIQSKQC